MKCKKCSFDNSEQNKFCANCGTIIENIIEVKDISEMNNENQDKKIADKNIVIKVLLWIFFLPIMLIKFILKESKLDKKIKVLTTIGVCFLFGLIGILGLKVLFSNNEEKIILDDTLMNDAQVQEMYIDATPYKYKAIGLKGLVFNVTYDSGYTLYQIYADPQNMEKNTFIMIEGSHSDIKEDDYIEASGYVWGELEYENSMSATMSAPIILVKQVNNIKKISYMEAVAPTIREVILEKSINQNNYILTVHKVEFSELETRIYISAENKAASEMNIYGYSSKIVQNGKQFEYEANYDADYKELDSEILPGVTGSGILTFPSIAQEKFNLVIEGYSGDYKIDLKPYIFDISVQ